MRAPWRSAPWRLRSFHFTTHAFLSHLGVAGGQSVSFRHCTHEVTSLQNAAGATQFAFVRHAVQRPRSVSQRGVVPPQSFTARHWTHLLRAMSQRGVEPPHWASELHPARHLFDSTSQMGVVPPQSAFEKHWTQLPFGLHRGAEAGQFAAVAHSTHCCVVGLHTGRPVPVQSAATLQPTHTPFVVLQIGASPGQLPGPVHAARQVWSFG